MTLFSDPRWSEALSHLPDYLGNHVRVSVTALALGLVVSLPLAVAARNAPFLRGALLGLASIVQTVPGLALLGAVLSAAAGAGGAGAELVRLELFRVSAFCRRCWRWRCIRCCRCCATPFTGPQRRRSGAARGRARRRHDGRGNRCSRWNCRWRCR